MPKLDIEDVYTKRAYYFGVIGLISFLVSRGLIGVRKLTETELPVSLLILIIIVSVFSSIACIYAIIKAKNEVNSLKKVIAIILAMASFVFILFLIKELIF